jgi:hypothetical protein
MELPMNPKRDDVSLNILGNVIRVLGPAWERRLTDADRALIRACCADAARLAVRALATPRNVDLQTDLLRERANIHARLAASAALGKTGDLADAFWDGVRATVNGAVTVAFTAL